MKKNYFLKWLTAVLCSVCCLSSVSAQNLVPNPGFEEGTGDTFVNWSKFNGADALVETSVATEIQDGSRALKAIVSADGNAYDVQLVSDAIPTVIGQSYTFTIYVKGAVGGTEIRFSTNPNALYSANYAVSEDWVQLSWTFTANDTATRMVLDLGAQANTYFLDTMEMFGPPVEGNNIVPNPSLELGSGDDFENWSKFNGAESMIETTDPNEVYDGARALKATVDSDGNAYALQFVSDVIPVIVGATYTFSMFIKATEADKNVRVTIKDQNGSDLFYGADQVVPTDWGRLSWSFTTTTSNVRISLDIGAFANTYLIDAMEMIEPDFDEPNLLLNAGFEQGNGDEFNNWGKFNGAVSLLATTETAEVYRGNRAVKAVVSQDGQSYEVQLVSDAFATTPGATYNLKAFAKSLSAENTTIQLSAKDADNGNADIAYSPNFFTQTDYGLIEWSFVATSTSSRVVFNMGLLANTYFLDDVNVQPICGETLFSPPANQTPIAANKNKFLGTVYSPNDQDISKYFNQITPENAGKWGSVETSDGVFNWSTLDEARGFAAQNGFPFRFHVLVWGNQQPTWLKPLSDEEKVTQIKEWFQAVAAHYDNSSDARKTLEYIEVANEIISDPPDDEGNNVSDDTSGGYVNALKSLNNELGTEPGPNDWIVNSFKLARQYFPCETKLVLNEYGIENESEKTAEYVTIIELLKKDNLIDVVGMQAHSFSTRRYGNGPLEDTTANLENNLNTMAATGLPLMVTEMDVDGDASLDENGERTNNGTQEEQDSFQLSEYQRIFDLYWNHPSVIGITLWGYRVGLWRTAQEAYIMDSCDGAEKPAMADYLNTVIRNGDDPSLNATFIGKMAEIVIDPEVQQYSDNITITVKIPGGNRNCALGQQQATIYIEEQKVGEVSLAPNGSDLIGSLEVTLLESDIEGLFEPGNKNVSAVFDNPSVEQAQTVLEIIPEDAQVSLWGRNKYVVKASSGVANIKLQAVLTDNGEDDGGDIGDLANAKVRFLINGEPVVLPNKTDADGYLTEDLQVFKTPVKSFARATLNYDLSVESEIGEIDYDVIAEVNSYYYGLSDVGTITVKVINGPPSVNVWPNPTWDEFKVDLINFDNKKPVIIRVYDIWGRKIYSTTENVSDTITFGQKFYRGVYFLSVAQDRTVVYKLLLKK
ncbi:endo-1,4-beta-xylanase [Pricia antarctica]|uniref:endo-1,4-beta-xylanase n=1 Tax=Pricia antarctica TaxID=641691 RepID=A0A1G7HV67_9FLAO|nr:endo-1,4-beta-xylanase [Pricia antarctica]SDF03959.1 endo-1,4-beta-xylanase [Pricia antarctica]